MRFTKEHFFKLNKIGIVRTDKIGDMVLTLPMFKILKLINPCFKTVLICSEYTKSLVEGNQYIDKYYFIEQFSIKQIQGLEQIDLLFFPRATYNEIKDAFWANIRYRVGTAFRYYSLLYNIRIKDHRKISTYHEAEYNLRMISAITKEMYQVELIKPIIKFKLSRFDLIKENKKIIILHPGSNNSSRDISINQWKIIINELLKYDYTIIITGTNPELNICNELSSLSNNIINYCGILTLDETISLISYSACLFANSTGIIHIAAALEVLTIGFYPNTPHIGAQRWRPYSKKSIIVSPDKGDDMNLISEKLLRNTIIEVNRLLNRG